MSYTIALTDFELPIDFDSAEEIISPMTEIETHEVKPTFQKYYDKITRIYPCICGLPDDQLDDGIWCDGPLLDLSLIHI